MDVRSWQLDHLRQQIALVPQTSVLFTGTIRENLQWGKQDATEDECWEALENRSGRRICTSTSKWFRYKSHGKRKKFLRRSKQRLTIARALIAKPELLILDDSLSALDYQTDLDLRKALQTYLGSTVDHYLPTCPLHSRSPPYLSDGSRKDQLLKVRMKKYLLNQRNIRKSSHHRRKNSYESKNYPCRHSVASSLILLLMRKTFG